MIRTRNKTGACLTLVPGVKVRPDPTKDWLLKANAEELADSIQQYWKKRGKKVRVWLEALPRRRSEATDWAIRSDFDLTQ